MILLASLLGGSIIGYRRGAHGRGIRLFVCVWLAVFAFQTVFLLATADNPRDRDTGAWDLGYFPFSIVVLAAGLAILWIASAIRARRSPRPVDVTR